MHATEIKWSEIEDNIAQQAFKKAYDREIAALIEYVRTQSSALTKLEDMWRLHDFLSARRHDIDGKYDYNHSVLIFVFAGLIKEGFLSFDDLKGLEPDKLTKIAALARM